MKFFDRFKSKSESTPDSESQSQANKTQEDLAAIKEKRERVMKLAEGFALDTTKQIEFPEGVQKPENSTGVINISKDMVEVVRNNVDTGSISTEKTSELSIAFPTKKLEEAPGGEIRTIVKDNVIYRIRGNKVFDCRQGDYKIGVAIEDIDSPQYREVETILSTVQ